MTKFKDALLFLNNLIVQYVEGSYIVNTCIDITKNHYTIVHCQNQFPIDQFLYPNLSPIANFGPPCENVNHKQSKLAN